MGKGGVKGPSSWDLVLSIPAVRTFLPVLCSQGGIEWQRTVNRPMAAQSVDSGKRAWPPIYLEPCTPQLVQHPWALVGVCTGLAGLVSAMEKIVVCRLVALERTGL